MGLKEKIANLKIDAGKKRDAFNLKLNEAKERAAEDDVEKSKALKKEAEELKAELDAKEAEIADLEELDKMNPAESGEEDPEPEPGNDDPEPPLKKKKGERRDMSKNRKKIDDGNEQVKSFEEFIRSRGQTRDGLTTTNQSIIVPKEISTDIFRLKEDGLDLVSVVTVKQVGTQSGTFPIAKRSVSATLKTKEELAEMDEVEADMFFPVDYKVETRAGQVALSNELIDDTEINVVAEVKDQLRKIITNTNNVNIIALFRKFTKKIAKNVDDVKTIKNTDLDPALSLSILTNQDGYNWMDLQKDGNGRYLLQDSISASSGKSFLGYDVTVAPNWLLKSETGFPIFIGDFAESIAVFDRKKVEVEWEKFDRYSEGLAAVIRNDYQIIDEEATIFIEISPDGSTGGDGVAETKVAKPVTIKVDTQEITKAISQGFEELTENLEASEVIYASDFGATTREKLGDDEQKEEPTDEAEAPKKETKNKK